jgi:PilZ domain
MGAKENLIEHRMIPSNLCEERRRSQRLHLQIPLFVRGRDAHRDQFTDLAKSLDVSALGALLTCPRPLTISDIITLTIPAPSITSSALVPAGMPPIQARVKRQQEAGDVYLIGVEFLKPIG